MLKPNDGFKANEGDTLSVNYPEIMVPVGHMLNVKIGGLLYTRKLREGDDVSAIYDEIYGFLEKKARRDGRLKIQAVLADVEASKRKTV